MLLYDSFESGSHIIKDARTNEILSAGNHSEVVCALLTLLKYLQKGEQK